MYGYSSSIKRNARTDSTNYYVHFRTNNDKRLFSLKNYIVGTMYVRLWIRRLVTLRSKYGYCLSVWIRMLEYSHVAGVGLAPTGMYT